MRVKLRTAFAYALAAHAIASVTKLRARARVLVASLAILATIAIPGIANASAALPSIRHSGTWEITAPDAFTQSNPSYTTHSTVSGCINVLSGQGTFNWHFQLIWYNGGKNTVLWASPHFGEGDLGYHCSPTITLHAKNPTVYSQETLDCNLVVVPCLLSGNWSLDTNS
jgi:hypothetical protein